MNWLQKISLNHNKNAFFFIEGHVFSFWELHGEWLSKMLSIPSAYANILRFAFPRGRAVSTYDRVVIEASPELAQYQSQIAQELELQPIDRPVWNFKESHYLVQNPQWIANQLLDIYKEMPSDKSIQTCAKFVPDLMNIFESQTLQTA